MTVAKGAPPSLPSAVPGRRAVHHVITGGGPGLVLTHGFAATSEMFEESISRLSRSNRVVSWDLLGHGQSPAPDEPGAYSVDRALDDLDGLIDAAGLDRAVLLGHSLGGYLSLAYCLQRPDRVAGLILVSTGPGFKRSSARHDWNEMAARLADRFEAQGLDAVTPEPDGRRWRHTSPQGLAHAARATMVHHDSRVIEQLGEIAVETLIVVGSADRRFLAGSRYMATAIQRSRLLEIDGAAHSPNLSHPEQFHAAVEEHLDRCWS